MILVTGGTGLVGAHLLLCLAKQNKPVRATHREGSDLKRIEKIFLSAAPAEGRSLFSQIEWVIADLNDMPAMEAAFKDVRFVYHCAAKISFDSAEYWNLRKTNIEGTANVVNLCVSYMVEKLCFVSSIAALDKGLGDKEVTEASAWNQELPHNQYAISKYGAEMEVWRGSQEGVPVVIVNPGVIIGSGIWDSGSGLLFSRIHKGLKYSFPKITGFVGVHDVVKAMLQLMESKVINEQFILVAENTSFTRVLKLTAQSLGKPAPSRQLKPWMVYMGWLYQSSLGRLFGLEKNLTRHSKTSLFEETRYSSEKIRQTLNFEFEPLEEVIPRTGKSYLESLKK